MNALELADFMQSKYDLFPKSEQMQVAEMLRKQDAAIKQLREAITFIMTTSAPVTCDQTDCWVVFRYAMKGTEEFAR